MRNRTRLAMLATLFATPSLLAAPPATERRTVTDTYHGVSVADDYRWLEDWNDLAVKAWSAAQNEHARATLDRLPGLEAIRARLTTLMTDPTPTYASVVQVKDKAFALKRQPPNQQPFIVVMDSPLDRTNERVLIDPGTLDPTHGSAIDWFRVSPDATLIAVSVSGGGSESGDVRVFDVATGKPVHEIVPRVNGGTAGGDLAWTRDSKGFFYTRYPRAGERPEADMAFYTQIYYHALGAPTEQDRPELGGESTVPGALPAFPRIAEIVLTPDPASSRLLSVVQLGDGGTFSIYLRNESGAWRRIADYADGIVDAEFGPGSSVLLLSQRGAPKGRILRLDKDQTDLARASVLIPESDGVIVNDFSGHPTIVSSSDYLFVEYQVGGPQQVRVFTHDGTRVEGPAVPEISTSSDVVTSDYPNALIHTVSYLTPGQWYEYDFKTRKTTLTKLAEMPAFPTSSYEVVREFATSKDGTKVPVNVIRKKGIALDGSHPVMLTGYGGYGVNITPGFRSAWLAYLEQGFVVAEAVIRGGGEYGDAWHRAGALTNKQNVFDDFAAAMRHMIDAKYTTADRLAIVGGSNGGLLMGAMITQHPDQFRATTSHVGIYDMLRVELSSNGAFNIPEFGTVADEPQFRALRAYSPYHNVRDGTKYPAVLFMTGANDPRVDPMQSRKMTARLQAAMSAVAHPNPVLLRTSMTSGHGMGTKLSERIEQQVDQLAFLCKELGVTPTPPAQK